jgi:hemolysin III
VAVAAFAIGMAVMFACSALLHLRPWSATTFERLFRLDHSGIYLAITGTGVAVAVLGLDGWPQRLVLFGMIGAAVVGIVLEWLPHPAPPGLNNAIYLSMGWVPVAAVPWLWQRSGGLVVGLLALGGVFYTSGVVVVGRRRPDPAPTWFGYHEIWHLLVIAAVAAHTAMVAVLASRGG